MDKAVLRNFAIESRKDLMEKIDKKIKLFYVDEEFKKDNRGDVIVLSNNKHTLTLTKVEDSNRDKLLKRIVELGYESVVEEAAYTWFNRLVAIRYMEVNNYLPLSVDNQSLDINVLSSKSGELIPDILKFSNLIRSDLDIGFNKEVYSNLQSEDAKYKYILLLVCKKLGNVIPQIFKGITDYVDLLIPDNLLKENSFISKMLMDIPISYFSEVEIIGWLYQYYNQTEKDRVVKSKKVYKKNEIAYATQIFTPDWIVKYLVDNSLGKYYLEHGGDQTLKNNMEYYIDTEIQQSSFVSPEEITFIDPCCGSGHILSYAFDLLYKMYELSGYMKKDIPKHILKNNIYGLDIDNRAVQLSIISIILKARSYDKDFFNRDIISNINIVSINDTANVDDYFFETLGPELKDYFKKMKDTYINSKEYGSLIQPIENNIELINKFLEMDNTIEKYMLKESFDNIFKQNEILSKKYSVVVTNPPYMNSSVMSNELKNFLKNNYEIGKVDLFSSFMIRNSKFAEDNGYFSFMTPNVWMFLKSYEKLRNNIINQFSIDSLIQLAKGSFFKEATVDICAFVIKKCKSALKGSYIRLEDFKGDMYLQQEKTLCAIKDNNCNYRYLVDQRQFKKIPGSPIAFWVSDDIYNSFNLQKLGDVADLCQGLTTTDNEKYVRFWYEVSKNNIGYNIKTKEDAIKSLKKWFPFNKGGSYRKWYGNRELVVNYQNDGKEIKDDVMRKYPYLNSPDFVVKNSKHYFSRGLTWSALTSGKFSIRFFEDGFICADKGQGLFTENDDLLFYLCALLNSKVADYYLNMISPTLDYNCGYVKLIPYINSEKYKNEIKELVEENINISKEEWNLRECSWDFKRNPIIKDNSYIKECVDEYIDYLNSLVTRETDNENKLDEYFAEIYNMNSYLNNDEQISISIPTVKEIIYSLISYSIGCMFGRYSLDEVGLIFAGDGFTKSRFNKYIPDEDNIIPISDSSDVYYNDDIVGKFKKFIEVAFGEKTLNDNWNYIADILGKKGTETSEDTIRRYFVNDFYSNHLKMYQKKPIYWLFDSGKKNGFKCLIYLHRYDEQIVSKIRTKYLHNTLSIYQRTVEEINYKLNNEELSTTDKRELQNKKVDINNKITECNEYEEMVGNVANKMIKLDLDDGVAVNYAKFVDDNGKSILAKIK